MLCLRFASGFRATQAKATKKGLEEAVGSCAQLRCVSRVGAIGPPGFPQGTGPDLGVDVIFLPKFQLLR